MEKLYADNKIFEIATPNEIREMYGLWSGNRYGLEM